MRKHQAAFIHRHTHVLKDDMEHIAGPDERPSWKERSSVSGIVPNRRRQRTWQDTDAEMLPEADLGRG